MKLYGVAFSNYTNMVHHALLEKGVEFEFIATRPTKEEDFLAKSPMGKVPLLETDRGYLTETSVILDFLEESYPSPVLLPQDAFDKAKVRQLMKVQELYVETPSHGLVGVLFDREIPEHVRANCQKQTTWGLKALGRLVNFDPFICGSEMTLADIFVFYSFVLGNKLTKQVYDWDMLQEVDGLADWYNMFSELEVTKSVLADN